MDIFLEDTRILLALPPAPLAAYTGLMSLWRQIAQVLHQPSPVSARHPGESETRYLCAALLEGIDGAVAAAEAEGRDLAAPSVMIEPERAQKGLHDLVWHQSWLEGTAALRAIDVPVPSLDVLRLRKAVLTTLSAQLGPTYTEIHARRVASARLPVASGA